MTFVPLSGTYLAGVRSYELSGLNLSHELVCIAADAVVWISATLI